MFTLGTLIAVSDCHFNLLICFRQTSHTSTISNNQGSTRDFQVKLLPDILLQQFVWPRLWMDLGPEIGSTLGSSKALFHKDPHLMVPAWMLNVQYLLLEFIVYSESVLISWAAHCHQPLGQVLAPKQSAMASAIASPMLNNQSGHRVWPILLVPEKQASKLKCLKFKLPENSWQFIFPSTLHDESSSIEVTSPQNHLHEMESLWRIWWRKPSLCLLHVSIVRRFLSPGRRICHVCIHVSCFLARRYWGCNKCRRHAVSFQEQHTGSNNQ